MRRTFAIVPVKPFDLGKSRLRSVLSDSERVALNRFFFRRTLSVVGTFPGANHSIVVSRCEEVLATAQSFGMTAVREQEGWDLNRGLAEATACALSFGADGVFVMPVDLPLTTPACLRALVEQPDPVLLLVADRHGSGTNFLYQAPVSLKRYQFGPRSLERHRGSGLNAGLPVVVRSEPRMAMDIDDEWDLAAWGAVERNTLPFRLDFLNGQPAAI